ncbi:MAG: hypothetical protein QOK46_943, partial [Microbacteriaceae bacterium]|nr:hypothetical protein [Microbacteriaceae bacterium]
MKSRIKVAGAGIVLLATIAALAG